MAAMVGGVGGLSHTAWRSFSNERKTAEASNFIDGDLVEALLDLPRARAADVANQVAMEVGELIKRVEDLASLH